jgi:hypothetical protein
MSNLIRLSDIKIGNRYRRDPGDIASLAESIRALGLLQPIALSPGRDFIDGVRRLEAVKRIGEQTIACHLVRGLDDLELLQAGLDANVCRKDPSPLEAWEMGQAIWNLEASAAKHRQREGGRRGGKMAGKGRPKENRLTGNVGKPKRRHDGETVERIARLVNMSARTYRKVEEVVVAAKKDPARYGDIAKKMDRTGNVDGAFKDLHKARRQEAAEACARSHRAGPNVGILKGDMRLLWDRLENDSVDLFLTDPPWSEISCYDRLAELAAAKLKPRGLCVTYIGKLWLPEVLAAMSKHLTYWWPPVIQIRSGTPMHALNIMSNSHMTVAFFKPPRPKARQLMVDPIKGSGPEKELYEWQQSQPEAEYLISHLTNPGDLVVDPFCGSGTFPAACQATGRRWLATEINHERVAMARRRLRAEAKKKVG